MGGYALRQTAVFVLTFASYLQIAALRKTLSYVKSTMVTVWVPSNWTGDWTFNESDMGSQQPGLFSDTAQAEQFLGALDSVFMFSYAVGLYFMGALTDRCDPRMMLSGGMIAAAVLTTVFGYLTEKLHFYSLPFYICVWLINGVCQSAGWPSSVKLMDNWFGKQKRGLIFGIWSSASSVGSITGAYICALMLPFGYEYAFLVNAGLLFIIALCVFFGIVSRPKDLIDSNKEKSELHHTDTKAESDKSNSADGALKSSEKPRAISFWRALLLPGVIAYALSYTCLKSVNYSIFFWLPYYMKANFGWDPSTSATLSTYYDWGGIVGSAVCGYASDLLGKRSPVLVSMLALSVCSLGGYAKSPDNKLVNGLLMGIVGFFVWGATNLVSSAVTADLGRQPAIMGNTEALSTISGIIEGSGSAGGAIGQAILPLVAGTFGWNSIFYMFMIMLVISLTMLLKLCYRETLELIQDYHTRILVLTGGIGQREKPLSSDIRVVAIRLDDEKQLEGISN